MNLLLIYLIASTLFYGFMFIIWRKGDWVNVGLKCFMFVLCIAGLLLALSESGVVILKV